MSAISNISKTLLFTAGVALAMTLSFKLREASLLSELEARTHSIPSDSWPSDDRLSTPRWITGHPAHTTAQRLLSKKPLAAAHLKDEDVEALMLECMAAALN